jgi:hypothetical protein
VDAADTIARLEAQVAALEAALERRSRELCAIQRAVCTRDLLNISRLQAGLPPLGRRAYDVRHWRETVEVAPAEVEEVLDDLWASVAPGRAADGD